MCNYTSHVRDTFLNASPCVALFVLLHPRWLGDYETRQLPVYGDPQERADA